jgi:hypothetical protein
MSVERNVNTIERELQLFSKITLEVRIHINIHIYKYKIIISPR